MRRRESGFSLLELLIAIAILSLVLSAAITFFTASVRTYKVQTKITETNVEGVIGLEILRQDVESLGFGLPWTNLPGYNEAGSGILNDVGAAPRAVVSVDNSTAGINNGADYLVIKSARVGMDNAAGKWTTLRSGDVRRPWGGEEDLQSGDFVVVLSPGGSTTDERVLLTPSSGADFTDLTAYDPDDPFQTNIVYGIGSQATRFPFNRADYYIADNSVYATPRHCAPITGTLVKRIVRNSTDAGGGTLEPPLPLLDCVADMQVVYGLDSDADGEVNTWSKDISAGMNAADIRTQLIEVRLHVLAQEGQRDDSYTHGSPTMYVGTVPPGGGRVFNLAGFRNYRWKLYSIVVRPTNLAR